MSTALHSEPGIDFRVLRHRIGGSLFMPDDSGWDSARSAWNLADQHPIAVAFPESAADVVTLVDFARRNGLHVAPQGTGHGATRNATLDDTILLKTTRMRGVSIDPEARIARVEAGVEWQEVVAAAAEHGLVALHGSSPDVGVIGYTLGGGIGWLARSHGLASSSVTAIELVTADGVLRRVDRENEPDLFWALRGGGGNFGVVTAMEFRLYPLTEIYAGWLWWPIDRAGDVLQAWRRWTADAPDEVTSSARLLKLPPLSHFPEEVRGKSFVVVEAAVQLDLDAAEELLAPLRALEPVMDTFAIQPPTALSTLHQDPDKASPGGRSDSMLLGALDAAAMDSFVALGTDSPFVSLELRHLGGELARPNARHGALASIDAEFLLFAAGSAPTEDAVAAFDAHVGRLRHALRTWDAKRRYYNFGGSSADSFWSETAEARLRRIKARYDESALVQANRVIPSEEKKIVQLTDAQEDPPSQSVGMSLLMINETLSSRRLASWEDAPTPCSWPFDLAGEVLDAWRRSNDDSVVRLLQYPPLPEIAPSVRGKSFVAVEPDPTPFYLPFEMSGLSILVPELTADSVDTIIDLAGAQARSPFVSLEVRRRTNGEYAVTALGIPSTEDSAASIDIRLEQLVDALH